MNALRSKINFNEARNMGRKEFNELVMGFQEQI